MSELVLFGPPQSSYMRTARWACEEKGIGHELKPVEFGSAEHLALHPYGKVPAMRHGDVHLFETSAIARYIDEQFDGPNLLPKTTGARAEAEQWISALNCYMYDHLVRSYALQYIIPSHQGKEPNRETIDATVPKMTRDLELLESAYEGKDWIAGDSISLADIFLAPALATCAPFPEAQAVLETKPNLKRFMDAVNSRDAYKRIQPPR